MTTGPAESDSFRRSVTGGARRAVKSLAEVQPAPGPRWPVALQAGLSISIPVAAGVIAGHEGLGLLAASGAFTCLYVAGRRSVERVRILPIIAAVLTLSAALGATLGVSPVLSAVGLGLVALAASAGAYAFTLGPPGALFPVLVYGLSAHVRALDTGAFPAAPWAMVAAVGAGSALTCVIAAGALVLPSHRRGPVPPLRQMLPGPRLNREARELLSRAAIVATLGTTVSVLVVDPTRAYWVVGGAIAVIGARGGRGTAAQRALHRIVGTLAGAGLYLALTGWVTLPAFLFVALLAVLQFAVEMVIVRNYALALTFITPLVLTIAGAATGGAGSIQLVSERVVDTAAGALLGALTALVHRRSRRTPAVTASR